MNQIELTPAEIEMINLKREQEELKRKETELRAQAEREKSIQRAKDRITEKLAESAAQVAAATQYAIDLGPGFEIKITESTQTEKVDDWSHSYVLREARIHCGEYKITVAMHTTWGKYGRGTNHGYKMYVSGPGIDWKASNRAQSKTKTVKAKIDDAIAEFRAQAEFAEKKKNSLANTLKKMKDQFANAEVTVGRDAERNYKGQYTSYDCISIKFPNGVAMKFKVYSDGTLERKSVTFSTKDQWAIMNALSNIELPATV